MPLPDILQQFDRLDKNSSQFPDQLTSLLSKEGFKDYIPKFRDEDVVWLVEYLDRVLDSLDPPGPAFRKCLSELEKICSTREKLPPRYILDGSLLILNKSPAIPGGSADVYEGLLGGSRVCVKRPRIYPKDKTRVVEKTFYREAVIWKHLAHPNIVPFLGITLEPLQLISAWIPGGELKKYIADNPGTGRVALLSGIADGLNYLHSRNIFHGDLKGPNIFVDDTGCPRITDFGLAMITQNEGSVSNGCEHAHTARWLAPEIFNEQGTCSKEADVFSFAMVMVEAFTGEVPFYGRVPAAALLAISAGKRPARPTHPNLTNKLWTLMQHCWNQDPHLRPGMSEVLKSLRGSDLPPDDIFKRVSELSDAETDEYPKPPKPIISGNHPGDETSLPISQGDSTGKDEGGGAHPSGSSQVAVRDVVQDGNNPHLSDKPERQLSKRSLDNNDASRGDVGDPHPDDDDTRAPLPALPKAPANCFSREAAVDEILDLMEQSASVALFGSIGVGKSFVALTLLHHNQTQAKFGRNRHFMRCDDLSNSLEAFLERLSDAIHTNRTTDMVQLRSHVETSPPFILVLDGVDFILDPLAPGAEEISATIEEFGSYDHVCLVTTSRMYPDIHGFHRIEVPTLSEDGARDAFYGLCSLSRSSAMDNLIARLDFHPLSINLFANSVRENDWDESALLKAWDEDQASTLEKNYHQTLRDAVEPVFHSPTIQKLGTTARNALTAIAAFPGGIEESKLEGDFLGIAGIGEAIDILCKFSLIYRQDGFVRMLSPFRFYFAMSLTPAECAEIIRWDADCNAAKAWLPVYTSGNLISGSSYTQRREAPLREKWIKRFRLMRRRLLAFFNSPGVPTIILTNTQGEPANLSPATPIQEMSSALTAYEVD